MTVWYISIIDYKIFWCPELDYCQLRVVRDAVDAVVLLIVDVVVVGLIKDTNEEHIIILY